MPRPIVTPEPRQAGPLPWMVVVLGVTYLLAGLTGHDPWKSEDAIGLAIAHGFLTGNDWLKPTLAGDAWTEVEPLYHWLAAASARLTQGWLPFHDGARLASGIFGGLFLTFLAGAARRFHGSDAAWGAPLLAIGTLGLLMPIHEAQPAAAVLAATTGIYWGISLLTRHPLAGALLMGASLGATFLAGGLHALLPSLVLLLVPLLQRRWAAFAIALCLGAVTVAAWPLLLAKHDPAFFQAWWAAEFASIAPYRGFSADHAKFIGWFAWPVLFIAPWALWRARRQLMSPEVAPLVLGTIAGLAWFLAHEAKVAAILPLMPPLILLAATGAASLRRGAANAWDWFGMMTLTIAAAFVWLGTVAMLTGWPPKLAKNASKLAPGYVADLPWPMLAVAVVATLAWILVLFRMPRSPWRVAGRWATGVTVFWVLLAALWVPWIDYGKTYRPVVAELRQALPEKPGCVARRHIGASQRAAMDYFGGIRARADDKGCRWLIVQGGQDESKPSGWTKVWEGHRPGDTGEWLRLYRRD